MGSEMCIRDSYTMVGNDIVLDLTQISGDGITLSAGDRIRATTFNNALGMKLRRETLEGQGDAVFNLRFDPLNASYMYVWLNGQQLIQGHDYTVNRNLITVTGKTITSSDRIDVMYFALDTAVASTGFRIFKDMLNRTFYLSLIHI